MAKASERGFQSKKKRKRKKLTRDWIHKSRKIETTKTKENILEKEENRAGIRKVVSSEKSCVSDNEAMTSSCTLLTTKISKLLS